jgi:hypothetical protein
MKGARRPRTGDGRRHPILFSPRIVRILVSTGNIRDYIKIILKIAFYSPLKE